MSGSWPKSDHSLIELNYHFTLYSFLNVTKATPATAIFLITRRYHLFGDLDLLVRLRFRCRVRNARHVYHP